MKVPLLLQYELIKDNMQKNLEAIKNLVKQSGAIQNLINGLKEEDTEQQKISNELKNILDEVENSIDSLLKQAESMQNKGSELVNKVIEDK